MVTLYSLILRSPQIRSAQILFILLLLHLKPKNAYTFFSKHGQSSMPASACQNPFYTLYAQPANPSSTRLYISNILSQETESPRALIRQGMQVFREGDVPSSIGYFDRADAAVPDGSLRPYLWQRGISYYYADRFQDGSDQFRLDVSVNPLDVEEIVWDIACLARIQPDAFPPPTRMSLPRGKSDRRRIMSTVYSLFRDDGATEYDLATAGHNGSISDEFYSLFYLALYCEIRNEPTKAQTYMKAAISTPYARGAGGGDYMTSCARVHCKLRGWA